jgi:hypothetical protein
VNQLLIAFHDASTELVTAKQKSPAPVYGGRARFSYDGLVKLFSYETLTKLRS